MRRGGDDEMVVLNAIFAELAVIMRWSGKQGFILIESLPAQYLVRSPEVIKVLLDWYPAGD